MRISCFPILIFFNCLVLAFPIFVLEMQSIDYIYLYLQFFINITSPNIE